MFVGKPLSIQLIRFIVSQETAWSVAEVGISVAEIFVDSPRVNFATGSSYPDATCSLETTCPYRQLRRLHHSAYHLRDIKVAGEN